MRPEEFYLVEEKRNAVAAFKRPLTPELLQQIKRDFQELCKPIISIMCDVYSCSIPRIIMFPDGRVEHEHVFNEKQQEILAACRDYIEQAKKTAFGEYYDELSNISRSL